MICSSVSLDPMYAHPTEDPYTLVHERATRGPRAAGGETGTGYGLRRTTVHGDGGGLTQWGATLVIKLNGGGSSPRPTARRGCRLERSVGTSRLDLLE